MALPSLNNKTAIGNLSLDDKASIISSLVHSGKLQLANYGAINFNQTVNTETGTATKEGGESFGGQAITNALSQIRNSISALSSTITNFLQSSMTEKQVAENFAEAIPKDIKTDTEDKIVVGFGGVNSTLLKILEKIDKNKTGTDGDGGGIGSLISSGFDKLVSFFGSSAFTKIFSGILKFLGPALGILGRSIPYLAAGYVLANLPGVKETGKELISKGEGIGQQLKDLVGSSISGFSQQFSEPGEQGNETGSQISQQSNTSATPTQQRNQSSTRVNGNEKQGTDIPLNESSTRMSKAFNSDRSIATDSDLQGISFIEHKNNPDKLILKGLAQRLQYIRKQLGGKNLVVTSGYRTAAHNRAVGGAKSSLHMKRMAVDIAMSGFSEKDKKRFLVAASSCGIGGIGFYPSFIHIDLGRKRTWGNIPNWAKQIIVDHKEGKYKMSDGVAEEIQQDNTPMKEEGEKGNNEGDTSTNVPAETKTPETTTSEPKTTATQEQGTMNLPEEEEEQEETSEKVYTDPSVKSLEKKETATKETTSFPEKIEKLFTEVEQNNDLPKGILKAIAMTETGQNTKFEKRLNMKSKTGAVGLMQFMPKTAEEMGIKDRTNPEQSIIGAGRYLAKIKNFIGSDDPGLLAAAYNSGPYVKDKEGEFVYKKGIIPNFTETKNYKKKVLAYMGSSSQETNVAESDSGQAAKPSEQQEPSISEKISSFVKDLGSEENIKATFTSGIGGAMELVGGALGFDTSRLNLPKNRKPQEEKGAAAKPKEIGPEQEESELDKKIKKMADDFFGVDKSSSLEMKKTEESKKLEIARQELSQAKEIKSKKESAPQQQQQPIVVNNTTKGGDSSPINPGVPNALETRDSTPAIQDLLYKALKSAFS